MILPRDDIAWVRAEDGQLTAFDERRLAESIQRAAELVGHRGWWPAESIAAAIHMYAAECMKARAIPASEVARVVAEVLAMLGYAEIAQAYARRGERKEIRLDEMVAQSSGGFELGFFRQLDTALRAVADEELSIVRLCGLRACVMQLRGAHRWGASCRQLAEEIVGYVRARASNIRPDHAAALRLAVLA
jgi:hypothetical protein